MAERRKEPARDPHGTEGGKDLEPLREGMREIEHGDLGPEHAREHAPGAEPPAPYHAIDVPEGGLTPRAEPGEGPTPPIASPAIEATAGRKISEERDDLANEAANAPRHAPGEATNAPRRRRGDRDTDT